MTKLFSERLKELRGHRSQGEVARLVGVNQTTYSNYELGKREPSYDILRRIVEIYDVSSDYLLGLSDDPRPARGGSVVASHSAVAIGGGDENNHVEVHGEGEEAGKQAGNCDCGLEEHREWFRRLKEQLEEEVIDEVSQALLAALLHVRQGDVCAFRRDGLRRANGKPKEEGGAEEEVHHRRALRGGVCSACGCGLAAHCVACAKIE